MDQKLGVESAEGKVNLDISLKATKKESQNNEGTNASAASHPTLRGRRPGPTHRALAGGRGPRWDFPSAQEEAGTGQQAPSEFRAWCLLQANHTSQPVKQQVLEPQ